MLVAVQVLLPTAPPRLVPGAGYADTVVTANHLLLDAVAAAVLVAAAMALAARSRL